MRMRESIASCLRATLGDRGTEVLVAAGRRTTAEGWKFWEWKTCDKARNHFCSHALPRVVETKDASRGGEGLSRLLRSRHRHQGRHSETVASTGLFAGRGSCREHSSMRWPLTRLSTMRSKEVHGPRAGILRTSSPTSPVSSTLGQRAKHLLDQVKAPSNMQKAASLHIEAFWERHYKKMYVVAAVACTWMVWRSMRLAAGAFLNISESLAVTGFTSLAATGFLALTAWFYRRRFVIDPSSVYRQAMLRLNSHPGVLEIMGAPVVGSDVRASVVTGGGLRMKAWRPKIRSRRVQMIFPLKGTDRKGLVSLEAKKRRGTLKLSLLAVDVPLPASQGGEQRVYIQGGPKAYERGGVLNELRRPFLVRSDLGG